MAAPQGGARSRWLTILANFDGSSPGLPWAASLAHPRCRPRPPKPLLSGRAARACRLRAPLSRPPLPCRRSALSRRVARARCHRAPPLLPPRPPRRLHSRGAVQPADRVWHLFSKIVFKGQKKRTGTLRLWSRTFCPWPNLVQNFKQCVQMGPINPDPALCHLLSRKFH